MRVNIKKSSLKKAKVPGSKFNFKRYVNDNKYVYLMMLPVIVWFAIFCYWPITWIRMAFYDYSLTNGFKGSTFVLFNNFLDFFEGEFFHLLGNTLAINLLALVFLFVFLFCLPGLDAANLAPISSDSLADAARGAPWLLSTMSVLLLLAFLSDRTEPGPLAAPFNRAFLALGLLAALLCVTVVATFGAKLTAEMHYPFFVMIRCIRIFRLLERVEALVVAQWVTTDFLLLGALLQAATGELTLCFPKLGARRGAVALTCLALALLSGALCASTSFSLRELSRTLVPIASASAAGVLVLAFVVGLIRKKI